MFINTKTGKPAWLLSDDESGVSYTLAHPSEGKPVHTANDFHATHREATREEIEEHEPKKNGSRIIDLKKDDDNKPGENAKK